MKSIITFATKHPFIYLLCCFAAGSTLRLYMAGGDIFKYMNPFWFPWMG
jgi:hypothetical protein